MASPNSTFTEMVSTTLREHRKEFTDNVTNHNALSMRLNKKGRLRTIDGGYSIVEPLDYAENGTYQRYSGYQTLNVSASEVLSAAEFAWKQAAIHVTASGLELRNNAGKNRLIALAKARMTNAMRSAKNNMSADIYSAGTETNQINGLQALVADAGTGTVGGINSGTAAFAFWKNIVQSCAAPLQGGSTITASKSTIQSLLLPAWLAVTQGNENPDLIVMDDTYFQFYEESLTDNKRYVNDDKSATGGFVSLKYKSADVFFDSLASGMPDAHAYILNTDYLGLVVHEDANWTEVGDQRAVNQDAVVMPIIWQGNLVTSNRRRHCVVKA